MEENSLVFLDRDLYLKLFDDNIDEYNKLKEIKKIRVNQIEKNKSSIKNLKIEKKQIKKNLKLSKRILKNGEKSLKNLNQKICLNQQQITNLLELGEENLCGNLLDQEVMRFKILNERQELKSAKLDNENIIFTELKINNKQVKNRIKLSKRAFRREKRNLKRVNKKLTIRKSVILKLANLYTNEEDKYIEPNVFNPTVYTKRR